MDSPGTNTRQRNLSPIPQGNDKSDLPSCTCFNLPSPESVFASPQTMGQRRLALMKSIEKLSAMQASDSLTFTDDEYRSKSSTSISQCQSAPSPQNELGVDCNSHGQLCSSLLSCVGMFLSDSLAKTPTSSGSPYLCPRLATRMSHYTTEIEKDYVTKEPIFEKKILQPEREFRTADIAKETMEMSWNDQWSSILNDETIGVGSYVTSLNNPSGYQLEQDVSFALKDIKNIANEKSRSISSDFYSIYKKEDDQQVYGTSMCLTPGILTGSLQDVQVVNDISDISGDKYVGPFHNQVANHEEPLQHHCLMRKRLQFETDKTSSRRKKRNRNSQDNECSEELSQILVDLDASLMWPAVTSSTMESNQSASRRSPSKSDIKQRSNSATDPIPSGIGLHLNSIVSIGQITRTKDMNIVGRDSCQGDKPLSGNEPSRGLVNLLPSTSLTGQGFLRSTARKDCCLLSNNDNSGSYGNVVELTPSTHDANLYQFEESLQSCVLPNPFTHHVALCYTKNLPSECTRSPLLNKASPRTKRKKANEGQKSCNCKRSKCLKLYCDCFAAGAVCTENCGCRECSNRPKYSDTIHQTRKLIQARNSLAFAPRIVPRSTHPPNDNEEKTNGSTISSGRHIKGCNCIRSLCSKKYCECYQSGVGCFIGCRCEGCKNTYGRKNGLEHKSIVHNKRMNQIGEKDEEVDALDTEQRNTCLSPSTPSLSCSSGPDVHKPLPPAGYYTSAESGAPILGGGQTSTRYPVGLIYKGTAEIARETKLLVSQNQELVKQGITDEVTQSPEWDGYPDAFNLSPLPKFSPGSSCITYSASESREPEILQGKSFQESALLTVGSFNLRCSPVTPVPKFVESKTLLEPDSGCFESHISNPNNLEQTSLPIKTVNAKSPKQKRVSLTPRHLQGTGRKLILRSLPSFAPLTPHDYDGKNDT